MESIRGYDDDGGSVNNMGYSTAHNPSSLEQQPKHRRAVQREGAISQRTFFLDFQLKHTN